MHASESQHNIGEKILSPTFHESASPATVLIVEDEGELAEILEYNLRKNGFIVHTAADGLSACRMTAEKRPDLILLDILLPDLDGWEICKLIRGHQDEEIATIPIIMMTALSALDHRLKGLEMGADDYLPKPYSIREVLLKTRDQVAKRRKMQALTLEIASLKAGNAAQADIQQMLFHELRNQLVVLGGFSSLLARNHGAITRERSKDYADAIQRSSQFLSTLAEEFLLARHLQSGQLELPAEPLDLDRLVVETLLLYRPLLAEKGIHPVCATEASLPPAAGHHAAVRLILSVLLENTLKYGDSSTALHIRTKTGEKWLEISVEDEGPGIPADEIDRIFDKFFRGRRAVQNTRGTGLGLYFARTLAEAMGAQLRAESSADRGSRFTLRLPRFALS